MKKDLPYPVQNIHKNPIPPRLQWNHNGGYCGEVSMISAGLYYGQYLSQYDVRSIAADGAKQNAQNPPGSKNYTSQLLLGTKNAAATAASLRLDYEELNSEDSKQFLVWVKNHVVQGHPVIIGVFNNENMLYNMKDGNGDDEYDHIVPVFGFGSNHPLTDQAYYPDDIILFSDNGLYTQPGNPPGYQLPLQGYDAPYRYFFTLDTGAGSPTYNFLLDREEANNISGNIYSLLELPAYQSPKPPLKKNYALAITGVKDPGHETLPIRIVTEPNFERPAIGSDSDERPAPMELMLTVTVSGLTPKVSYNLYRYDDENKVPTEKFNFFAANAISKQPITIDSGSDWSTTLKIQSNQKVFFRAVAAAAA